jgi:hypothetical protein
LLITITTNNEHQLCIFELLDFASGVS